MKPASGRDHGIARNVASYFLVRDTTATMRARTIKTEEGNNNEDLERISKCNHMFPYRIAFDSLGDVLRATRTRYYAIPNIHWGISDRSISFHSLYGIGSKKY